MNGNISIDRIRTEIKKLANNFDVVTTLYDFYGFKKLAIGETKKSLEDRMLEGVHDSIKAKLIPYIQMHEFEALLFCCAETMARVLREPDIQDWCQCILNEYGNYPERINNSPLTAPSKRLLENTGYRKTTHGSNIAAAIGIDKIRRMCPGFDEWLNKIESLQLRRQIV